MVQFDAQGQNLYSHKECMVSVIMYSRDRPEIFRAAIESVFNTCSNPGLTEIIIKFDSDDPNLSRYIEIVKTIKMPTKIVINDRLNGYWSIHTYLNDLSKIASGKILWILGDDINVLGGDWVASLLSTRDVHFKDNIYVIHIPGIASKRGKMIAPALTRELIDVLGFVSPHPAGDRFLAELGGLSGRIVSTPDIEKIVIGHDEKNRIARLPIDRSRGAIKTNITTRSSEIAPILRKKIIEANVPFATVAKELFTQ